MAEECSSRRFGEVPGPTTTSHHQLDAHMQGMLSLMELVETTAQIRMQRRKRMHAFSAGENDLALRERAREEILAQLAAASELAGGPDGSTKATAGGPSGRATTGQSAGLAAYTPTQNVDKVVIRARIA